MILIILFQKNIFRKTFTIYLQKNAKEKRLMPTVATQNTPTSDLLGTGGTRLQRLGEKKNRSRPFIIGKMVGAPWDGGPFIINYFGGFFIGYHPKKIHHFPYETKPSNKINVQPTCLFQKQPVETRFSPNYPPWRSQKLCQVSGFVKQLLNHPFYSQISIS